MVGWAAATWSTRWVPATESCTLAAVTSTARSSPRVSVTMLRLRPTIFFAASVPLLVRGTLVEVFTLWVSMTEAVGVSDLVIGSGRDSVNPPVIARLRERFLRGLPWYGGRGGRGCAVSRDRCARHGG